MATVTAAMPVLTKELSLFHTTDPLLGNSPVLVFHGPSASIGATSSRIQVHVFTPAGLGSYTRLSVSPNSPFYSAVSNLPREEQGDEVCRGLAFGLKKYFSELPGAVRKTWCAQSKAPSLSALFGDDHIAILATRMTRIENVEEVIGDLAEAFCEQRLSWLDVDVVLPPGTIKEASGMDGSEDINDEELLKQRYGRYSELIASLGEVCFIPTSKIKRAPSKALAIGRTASFRRHNKENVRDQLAELLNTEDNYVSRVGDLLRYSEDLGSDLKERHQSQLREVFSPAIGQIMKTNTGFLDELRRLVEESEETAVQDIERTSEDENGPEGEASADASTDASGLVRVAQSLCEWLPQFAECYTDYLSTHAHASQTLRALLRNGDSLAAELQNIGEQKLTSLMIEPVQRLPRYNLYIDSLSKQLPIRHPALKLLLKARDIVSGLCAESVVTESSAVIDRLRSRTIGWQADVDISGRLITAIDFVELVPPYRLNRRGGTRGILLLFTDGMIVVEKAAASKATARNLLTEIESGSMPSKSVESLPDAGSDLHFVRRLHLDDVQCTESHDGQAMQVMTFFQLSMGAVPAQEPILDSCQVLQLENAYEGRAARFVEELSKARVEGRFSESERESSRWEFRATDLASDSLGLLSAVVEDSNNDHVSLRSSTSLVRILVDIDRHAAPPRAGQNGIRTIVALSPTRAGDWRMTIDSIDGAVGREHLEVADLVPAIRRKLATLIGVRLSIEQTASTACLLARNSDLLQSIELHNQPQQGDDDQPRLTPRDRVHRPKSPKKLLSSFLSSVGPGNEPPLLKRELPGLPMPNPNFRLSTVAPKPPSRESRPSSRDQPFSSSTEHLPAPSPAKKLEDTLSAYILALQARKGNIVGKNLKMRVVADELQVSELYNSLLEDPNMMVLAAQAPLDVLFASFEKFLNLVWIEQIGQVIPSVVLEEIQLKAETLFPADFDQFFRTTVAKLAPQNQRAFKAIMKLLAELLDGTGNDGDRGILTAAFAEILVTDGNPHDYIALIDRFVDDTETYFGEPVEAPTHQRHDTGSVNSHKRTRSANSASLTSNTSSLRRKFGFGTLTRENSKSEQESKVASVWRTLSKSTRGDTSPGPTPVSSFSKGSLSRARSVETEASTIGSRPSSSDGLKAPSHGDAPSLARTPSSHNLTTIGEHPSFIPTGPPRKKRRSSLSDLKMLDFSPKREQLDPPTPQRPQLLHTMSDSPALPNTTVPSTPLPISRGNSNRYGTPQQGSPRSRLPSSFRRDLSPGPSRALGHSNSEQQRPKTSGDRPDVVITARPISNIPSLMPKPSLTQKHAPSTPARAGLSERQDGGNIVKKPSPQPEKTALQRRMTGPELASSPAPRKLRMQSPQKLRERLQQEQTNVAATHITLQEELSKIGNELTSTSSPARPATARGSKTFTGRGSISQPSNMDLAQRVLKMEGSLPKQMDELSRRISSIQGDLTSSLSVSEQKCRKLDELYREANGENEALYARFNDELGRILKAVRGGEGVEELKKKLKEAQLEAANLKRETSRLKRENVGLRAQMRE
ncbi:related to Rho guanyl nucleotide exchange factor [Ramularia collo-cygni]|uniref:Related to Rho guanyl nucleotide exchange factor n=1 Tax=Ramularia collo-cygni TaxID=112498 RepID=A0A2D3UX52_9PEZI|nr:related to Rho guanyl nucleotide exchange factor [Ramularia collo-cygni]CZT14684.1 related to Rho guanyl nucleotide exchange factor [Ramularia collo-cygni]